MNIICKDFSSSNAVINFAINSSFQNSQANSSNSKEFYINQFESPIGEMVAIFDDNFIYLLEFTERKNLKKEIITLIKHEKAIIKIAVGPILDSIKHELDQYFKGKLQNFKTPIKLIGTEFQKKVWQELLNIPFGHTNSYRQQACNMNMNKATRAVANANGRNQFAIIVPCHRVLRSDGGIGGYGGQIFRKEWLIQHEQKYCI